MRVWLPPTRSMVYSSSHATTMDWVSRRTPSPLQPLHSRLHGTFMAHVLMHNGHGSEYTHAATWAASTCSVITRVSTPTQPPGQPDFFDPH